MMERFLIDILGWVGAVTFLIAYWLVSARRVEGDSWIYQGLNFFAGILLIINTVYLEAYPSAALNIAWAGIAMATIGRKAWKKHG
ncbi:MAG: hypothetical protein FJZ87_04840 [Chloroflexi bacterium]|nr:hypothetical protein [Chloroflexota bacterium]